MEMRNCRKPQESDDSQRDEDSDHYENEGQIVILVCHAFDWIAQQVGVVFPSPKHYRIRSRLSKMAGSGRKMDSIDFDRKWLLSLSEQARCSMIVHEFWHWII